jgi:predicted flap endonuclease-1-like 5' DNA nuclease
MSYKIDEIEGIGPAMKEKLAGADIHTTEDLLKACCDKSGRKTTSETTGIGEGQLLKWTNMADLMRISGVGEEFSDLLEAAGVDTVKELRNRIAANLAKTLQTTNEEKKLTRAVPGEGTVQGCIDQAKELDSLITH